MADQTPGPLGEARGLGEEGEDEEGLACEVEEVAGMDEDAGAVEEPEDEILVGGRAGDAEDGRPPPLGREELDRRQAGHRRAESGEVAAEAVEDRGADAWGERQ